jgi:hypothetical protein
VVISRIKNWTHIQGCITKNLINNKKTYINDNNRIITTITLIRIQ